MKDIAWECSCGHIEYGAMPPEDCPVCFRIDSFAQLPEELIEEREKDKMEELEMINIKPVLPKKKSKIKKTVKKTAKKTVKKTIRRKTKK